MRGALAMGALASCVMALTGCNTMNGPAVIEIDSADYSKAFEACIEGIGLRCLALRLDV